VRLWRRRRGHVGDPPRARHEAVAHGRASRARPAGAPDRADPHGPARRTARPGAAAARVRRRDAPLGARRARRRGPRSRDPVESPRLEPFTRPANWPRRGPFTRPIDWPRLEPPSTRPADWPPPESFRQPADWPRPEPSTRPADSSRSESFTQPADWPRPEPTTRLGRDRSATWGRVVPVSNVSLWSSRLLSRERQLPPRSRRASRWTGLA
jgi:hypothetical protein